MNAPSPINNSSVPDETPVETEVLAPYLMRQWLLNRRIVVYKVTEATRHAVDAWIDAVKETRQLWPPDQVYLAIHEFSDVRIMLTPYARTQSSAIITEGSHAPGYAAIVVRHGVIGQAIQVFLKLQHHQLNENQVFFSYKEALNWLKSKIPG